MNHANAGKKCMGTARPGNSSGFLRSNGRVTDTGMIMLAKERMLKLKLKMISAFGPNHFFANQYPMAATMQADKLNAVSTGIFTSFAKLASNAKK